VFFSHSGGGSPSVRPLVDLPPSKWQVPPPLESFHPRELVRGSCPTPPQGVRAFNTFHFCYISAFRLPVPRSIAGVGVDGIFARMAFRTQTFPSFPFWFHPPDMRFLLSVFVCGLTFPLLFTFSNSSRDSLFSCVPFQFLSTFLDFRFPILIISRVYVLIFPSSNSSRDFLFPFFRLPNPLLILRISSVCGPLTTHGVATVENSMLRNARPRRCPCASVAQKSVVRYITSTP